ncbi:DUF3320 domain-containing protein [Proteiniclasticum ruminis]|uniref:AAA domain-containing protein n=1 Tax=Proteiniclasticum ruminis TaxID=398199 RepID=A0A1I4XS71_9CLOT|nr:DUF3320 domain-containing protein [Proteiniclasticum ruminis]SFN28718.1 Protein of unknown function [Proteiniclasticum ruminis]
MEVKNLIGLDLVYGETLHYAMTVQNVPFIRKCVLRNLSEEPLSEMTLRFTFSEDLAEEVVVAVSILPPLGEIDLGAVHINLRKEMLFLLTEMVHLSMKVQVVQNEEILYEHQYPVELLSYNQWQGMETMPELLAAFVTPNHPSIDGILLEASELLKASGKDPSFEGYQSRNPNRVLEEVHAIYQAISNRGIRYIGPPASFHETGQRIRLSSEVLEKSMGTCLDLTLLLCSCLEAISLNPLILLMEGHSYLGYWLEEEFFQDPVLYDVTNLRKRTAEGMSYIGVLETTSLREGLRLSFEEAVAEGLKHLEREGVFLLGVDVKRARAGRILPLPERVEKDGKMVLLEEAERKDRADIIPELKEVVRVLYEEKEGVLDKKSRWERKLLDLSLRNQLLSYQEKRKGLRLLAPDIKLLEDSLYDGKEYTILPGLKDLDRMEDRDSLSPREIEERFHELLEGEFQQGKLRTLLREEDLEKKITKIYRDARTQMEESVANQLFLTVGMLKWYETDSSQKTRFAPILLIPVELKKKLGKFTYSLSARDEDTLMNVTLLEKLKMDFNLDVNGLEDLPMDERGVHVLEVLSRIRGIILGKKRWDVLEETHVGLFSFSKFVLWHDLKTQGEAMRRNEIIASLLEGKRTFPLEEEDILDSPETDPAKILLPVSTDASQLKAVKEALKGKSFVLHGPPGTGKSQTITTIIANALYQGKKVLFVAEKMAALSVVQKRLDSLGLGDFSLEVHSNKSKKTAILKKLEETTKISKNGTGHFEAEAAKLQGIRDDLGTYVEKLYQEDSLGFSAYDYIGGLEHLKEVPYMKDFTLPVDSMKKEDLDKLSRMAEEFAAAVKSAGPFEDAPLKGIGLTDYRLHLKERLQGPLEALTNSARDLQTALDEAGELDDLLITKMKLDGYMEFLAFIQEKTMDDSLLLDFCIDEVLPPLLNNWKKLEDLRNTLDAAYMKELYELPWMKLEEDYAKGITQGKVLGFLQRRKALKVLSSVKKSGSILEEEVLPLFDALREIQRIKDEIHAQSSGSPLFLEIPSDTPMTRMLEALLREKKRLHEILSVFDQEEKNRVLSMKANAHGESGKRILEAYSAFSSAFATLDSMLQLHIDTLEGLEGSYLVRLQDRLLTYRNNLDQLRTWTRYNEIQALLEEKGLNTLVESYKTSSIPPEQMKDALVKSIYFLGFQAVLEKEPLLMKVSGESYEEKIRYFKEVTAQYEEAARKEIISVLSSRVPDLLKEASSSSEVGILQRAIRSGGRGVTLRSLFEKLPHLLPRITPCMLMSPLSVAQYLSPAKAYFDLVIFDEASQMPTAEAVGAMSRGEHVVIVGDPKQLPPTAFFQAERELEEDGVLEDLDNILEDALALSLPETSLLWHYRSRHESLIAFSNKTYYENQLYTYPSPRERISKVSYEYVSSVYGRGGSRANKIEAEKVVEEILKRAEGKEGMESIGVVTFSTAQKDMIEDLLGEAFRDRPELEEKLLTPEEPLFVKNLENVQGDERDVILFSIGYGPDENGKITLNFGPLNRENGWKRLNVAITRAKKEMKIFTSIQPEQMDITRTSARGVENLKEFLEYARRGRSLLTLDTLKREEKEEAFLYSVKRALEEKGLQVDALVGSSKYRVDLGIVDETDNSYRLGLQCFGESYQHAETVRDRDVLQESVLKGLGWHIHKVHPLDWTENREKEIEKIFTILNGQENHISEKEPPRSIRSFEPVSTTAPSLPQEEGTPYQEAFFTLKTYSSEEFRMPKNTRQLKDVILRIIEIEAPISLPVLYRQVLKAFSVRYTEKNVETVDAVLSSLGFDLREENGVLFLYSGTEDSLKTFRTPIKALKREVLDLPETELLHGARFLLKTQISLPEEALKEELLKTFGLKKHTEEESAKLSDVLHKLSTEPQVTVTDGIYVYKE